MSLELGKKTLLPAFQLPFVARLPFRSVLDIELPPGSLLPIQRSTYQQGAHNTIRHFLQAVAAETRDRLTGPFTQLADLRLQSNLPSILLRARCGLYGRKPRGSTMWVGVVQNARPTSTVLIRQGIL